MNRQENLLGCCIFHKYGVAEEMKMEGPESGLRSVRPLDSREAGTLVTRPAADTTGICQFGWHKRLCTSLRGTVCFDVWVYRQVMSTSIPASDGCWVW